MIFYFNTGNSDYFQDAGSRITHHTSTTVQEDPLSTEDSIRAKIDRMFAFVEGDDLGKHIKENNSSPSSVTLMGKSFRESAEETHRKSSGTLKEADCSETLAENDIEYSLSHYREIQREQLRRRLPSADEPQFFCSPSISVPHAGQRVDAYKTKEHLGASVIREKVQLIHNVIIFLVTSGLWEHIGNRIWITSNCFSNINTTWFSAISSVLFA